MFIRTASLAVAVVRVTSFSGRVKLRAPVN